MANNNPKANEHEEIPKNTFARFNKQTLTALRAIGNKGQTYDDVVKEMMFVLGYTIDLKDSCKIRPDFLNARKMMNDVLGPAREKEK